MVFSLHVLLLLESFFFPNVDMTLFAPAHEPSFWDSAFGYHQRFIVAW